MTVRIEAHAEPVPGYKLLDRLGSGGFGEVWRAEAPGGIFKAIKIINGSLLERGDDSHRFAEQELKALKRVQQVRHPYLLALDRYDIVEGRLFITMELADCNLWDRFRVCRKHGLPGIPRDELLRYMSETAEVLDLFNDKFQLQHLDIKPQNLFLLHGHVKVADFGQVKDLEGLMAAVTGGITPVYAAPETFDGFVSRFCDQYSLACVYQELLTGSRPFDGTSMQQLLMQHLQMPPNLNPSPPCDRGALAVALSKRPDDRFPNVMAFVNALKEGGELPRPGSGLVGVIGRAPTPGSDLAPSERIEVSLGGDGLSSPSIALGSSGGASGAGWAMPGTPSPRAGLDTMPPPERPAPPLETGPGCLRPTVVIGLGYTGLQVLQRYRKLLSDRYGPASNTPLIRTVYFDTDPDALLQAANPPAYAGFEALAGEDVFAAKLQRPAYYLKPRASGRTLVENWFDAQLLYKLPRNPVTMGLRAFGRLAFCDHYRAFVGKLSSELDAALAPAALDATRDHTGEEPATNRPRVVIVAGLGGGTGGGAFLDAAYTARARLKRIGYPDPEVVGLLMVPPDDAGADLDAQTRANTYAALTELHHYSRPETVFSGNYDDRANPVRESDPPFTSVCLMPAIVNAPATPLSATPAQVSARGRTPAIMTESPRHSTPVRLSGLRRATPSAAWRAPARQLGSADPQYAAFLAADWLRLQTLTQLGPTLDAARAELAATAGGAVTPMPIRAAGAHGYTWPRGELVARGVRVLSPVLVGHWVSPDPAQVRQVIPAWATEQWGAAGLEASVLSRSLVREAGAAVGHDLEAEVLAGLEALAPRGGWRARPPEPAAVAAAVARWQEVLSRPNPGTRAPSALAEAFTAAADARAEKLRDEHARLFANLIEAPNFRLAGTEEALRRVVELLDKAKAQSERKADELARDAVAALDHLLAVAQPHKGARKLTPAEFQEAATAYPHGQLGQLGARAAVRVYHRLRDHLAGKLAEVAACRSRVEEVLADLTARAEAPPPPLGETDLLPAGCASTEDAAQTFLRSLTDDDLLELDHAVQHGLEERFGGLYQACLNITDGADGLTRILAEQARRYLHERLGQVDFDAMLTARAGGDQALAHELRGAYDRAAPGLVGPGPWSRAEFAAYLGPVGPGGEVARDVAAGVLPETTYDVAAPDEVAVYREYPDVPLAALAQFGPAWAGAYRAHPDAQQASAHTRLDVTQWIDVDAP